jgi:3-hydroxyisobutyrate dehydrogenase-like beta-hydroxyacid dehydrogenase
MTSVAVLHPGSMGAALAREAGWNTDVVRWLPAGRSAASTDRAQAAGLIGVDDAAELFAQTDVVLSVCPPGQAADEVADLAVSHGFRGIFVDANAISPQRAAQIAERLEAAGAHAVDAAVIGSPPSATSSSTLYLSGPAEPVSTVAALFAGTHCTARDLQRPVGAASALKAAFASYNKGATVLAAVSHALAAQHGLEEELLAEAQASVPGSPLAHLRRLQSSAAKAWRWVPEFSEIAAALTDAGLPPQTAQAVGHTLELWSDLKDDASVSVTDVLDHLRTTS